MAEDLRRRVRFAASMSIYGLMADIGYVTVEAAVRFSLIHWWAEATAYCLVSVAATALAVTSALARVERELGRD